MLDIKSGDLIGKDWASHLTCLDILQNCAVATVQAVGVEIFKQDDCVVRSDRFPIVEQ